MAKWAKNGKIGKLSNKSKVLACCASEMKRHCLEQAVCNVLGERCKGELKAAYLYILYFMMISKIDR